MVIDASALAAIFFNEPERDRFLDLISNAGVRLLSAATAVETGIVIEARTLGRATPDFELFLHEANIEIVSVDSHQAERARAAFRQFGKGRHPAALNFGDCFVYALATVSGEPVLAKGSEFALAGLQVLL